MASAPVLREGELVGAFYLDYSHDEVVGDARRLAWGVAVVAGFWIAVGLGTGELLPRPDRAAARAGGGGQPSGSGRRAGCSCPCRPTGSSPISSPR